MLGGQIRAGRIRRGWTVNALAERVGVSKPTIVKVERGDPGVAIGTVFEAAILVGVPLFHVDADTRAQHRAFQRAELTLLPGSVRERHVDDDF